MVALFQMCGIVLVLSAMLYMFVRYLMAEGPKCLRCLMLMPSGPVELLLVLSEMADCIWVVVRCVLSVTKFLTLRSIHLLILLVLYGVTFVNCLLNAFALSLSVIAVLVPKRMLLFCCVGDFFCDSFAIVLHSECGLCL